MKLPQNQPACLLVETVINFNNNKFLITYPVQGLYNPDSSKLLNSELLEIIIHYDLNAN